MSTTTTTADKIVRCRAAVEFLGKRMTTADVALVLGVSVLSVKRWKRGRIAYSRTGSSGSSCFKAGA